MVTLESIKAKIKGETYLVMPDGRTTICQLTLENGYTVNGYSACVDAGTFDRDLGRKYAFEDALNKIWPLEGYLSAQRLHDLADSVNNQIKKATDEFDKEYAKWNVKTAGRRITAKLAPYGLKKDGSPAKKRGRPAK